MSDVLGKQQWFREYRESEGIEELLFVGSFGPTDPVTEVAGNIREVIDVDGARQRASNWEGFMRELTRNAEQSGIMIMRSGVVGNNTHRPLDVEEFRGFSVSDHVAPLIFINGQDFRGAQIFTLETRTETPILPSRRFLNVDYRCNRGFVKRITYTSMSCKTAIRLVGVARNQANGFPARLLAHEMAHIWAGQGGLSNPDYGLRSEWEDSTVEQFCNRVAAETLVPGEDFRSR